MRLSLEQVKRVMSGCLDAGTENGGIRFHRMNPPLAEFYRRDESSRIRMECTAGVRLRFASNTGSIRIGLGFGAAARPFYQGVLLTGSREPMVFGPASTAPGWEGEIFSQPQRVEQAFDLWLPHLARTDLLYLELEEGATFTPAPRLQRWLALGDSITQGMTVRLPTSAWVARCTLGLGWECLNYGIGGATMDPILSEVGLPPHELLSVAYGTNDFCLNIEPGAFAANLTRLLSSHAKAHPHTTVVLITAIPWVGNESANASGHTLDDFRKASAAAARAFPACRIVNGPTLIDADAARFVDNVHPNDEGMAQYARNLLGVLQRGL